MFVLLPISSLETKCPIRDLFDIFVAVTSKKHKIKKNTHHKYLLYLKCEKTYSDK